MLLPRRVLRSVILLVLQLTCVGAFTTGSDKQHRSFVSSRSSLSSPQSQQQLQLQRDTSSLQSSISGINNAEGFYTDDEWHPHDPAYTTPQLLSGIWGQIARGTTMVKGDTSTVIYPDMHAHLTPRFINLLMAHLDCCKDVCDSFGISMTVSPYQKDGKVTGFTVKSFRNPDNADNDYDFDYDPFWDDGTDFDNLYTGVDDEEIEVDPYPKIEDKAPDDDDKIINTSKRWVSKLMSDMGLCPFTQGPEQAGLPVGQIFYCVDRGQSMEDMYARYWKEVVRVEQHKEKDLSTTLLIAPEFCMDNVELFESFSTTLTQPLTALGVEDLLQLVFFHPHWSFRDGNARSGAGQAANYARRSPWPMINILRTSQVRAAQKGIPTGLVYKQNEKTLTAIGVDKLETMLRMRDWSDVEDVQVNRKEFDALKIAQGFQETGSVRQEDISLEHDNTPAANKVDKRQMEDGNLVNVLEQALAKRLGVSAPIAPLSGPETSATALAVDYLIKELDAIAQGIVVAPAKVAVVVKEVAAPAAVAPLTPEGRRAQRIEAARRAMLDEISEAEEKPDAGNRGFGDPMSDVLFGRGGVPDTAEDPAAIDDSFDATNI